MPYTRIIKGGIVTWYSRVDRRVIPNCTGDTKNARNMALDWEAKQRRNQFNEDCYGIKTAADITFKKASETYLETYAKIEKPKSMCTDEANLVSINAFMGNKLLSEIKLPLLLEFKSNQLLVEKINPATFNRKRSTISSIYKFAIETGLFHGENPAIKIPLFNEKQNQRSRFFTQAEMDKLYAATQGELKTLICFAVNTGMRTGEIMRLIWRDIDLQRSLIYIRQTKTDMPRQVPINSTIRQLLLSMKRLPGNEHLFENNHEKTFSRLIKKLKMNDGETCFYTLRHTFASNLAMAGVDLYTVSKLLGHSNAKTTERYAHLCPNFLQNATERIVCPTNSPWKKDEEKASDKKSLQAA